VDSRMRAAVYHGRGDVRVEDVPVPEPGPGEVLVRVTSAGVCGTDGHEFAHGPRMLPIDAPHPVTGHVGPLVIGHEFAGRVVALGAGVAGPDAPALGSLVVSGSGISCGDCRPCREGRTNLCVRYATLGLQRNGGLAEYCAVPAAIAVPADAAGLPDHLAALGQPMAIAVHARARSRLAPGEVAVVVGVGGIGAFLVHAAVALGARVVVCDLDPERLRVAEALGASAAVAPDAVTDAAAALGGADAVFEVSGTAGGLATALRLLPTSGRLIVVGLQGRPVEFDLAAVALRELEVIGTNAHVCGQDLPEAVRLLGLRGSGWSDVAPRIVTLEELAGEVLPAMGQGRTPAIKTLIDPAADRSRDTA
jgi:(R,R)-butanediol dehydrogenase / meso-butanediol dehydrogenase / diacetyl reductase